MRRLYTFAFLLLTTLGYGQKSTLLQNVNTRAKELKHKLNDTGDSLILKCERTIYRVEIFNKDFEKSLIVKDSKVKIPLKDIPVGRFVVEAVLPDRLIVITLLRNEIINNPVNITRPNRKVSLFGDTTLASNDTSVTTPEVKIEEPKLAVVNKKEQVIDKKPIKINRKVASAKKKPIVRATRNLTSLKPRESLLELESTVIDLKRPANNNRLSSAHNLQPNSANKRVQAYWIVYQTNNRHSSGREMRFGDDALVDKMISHINLDKRTVAGKDNELTVWEIYDVSAFLKYKMKNPDDYSKEAECFNKVPYFKTGKNPSTPEP
ncbi:hypothetical protein [uncultured Winogradskyella sp.]|uniref:hypothetical protein n=1 Tax=uncultured Winogradskyella sp. TaxID=395353 RepID=UPI00260EE2AD|nr:hypothetical protein [uncultured Winogradskyella sp.]